MSYPASHRNSVNGKCHCCCRSYIQSHPGHNLGQGHEAIVIESTERLRKLTSEAQSPRQSAASEGHQSLRTRGSTMAIKDRNYLNAQPSSETYSMRYLAQPLTQFLLLRFSDFGRKSGEWKPAGFPWDLGVTLEPSSQSSL